MNRAVGISIVVFLVIAAVMTLPGIAFFLIGMTLPAPARGSDHSRVTFDIAPDGNTIVFGAADGDLHEFDLATGIVNSLTQTERWEQSPGYSGDGKWIVYVSCDPAAAATNISLRSRDGQLVRDLTSDTKYCDDCPSFSPDGSQVVFTRAHRHRPYSMGGWTWDDWDVYVINVDGSNLRRITGEKHYQLRWPRFTANGKQIYYGTIADRQTPDTTRVTRFIDLSGNIQPGPLQRPEAGGGTGAWTSDARQSLDGAKFVFISDRIRPFSYDVATCDSNGRDVVNAGVTGSVSKFYNNNPIMTPDNTRILFLTSDVERIASADFRSLWEVQADGSNPREIAGSALFTNPRSWKGLVQR